MQARLPVSARRRDALQAAPGRELPPRPYTPAPPGDKGCVPVLRSQSEEEDERDDCEGHVRPRRKPRGPLGMCAPAWPRPSASHTLLLLRSVVGAGRADRVPRGTLCPAPLVPFPHRAARRVRPARDSPGPRSSPTAPPAQSEGAPRERGGAGGEGKAKQRPRHWRVRLSSAFVRNTHTPNPKTTAARRLQGDPGFPVSKPAGALPPARRTLPPEHPHEGRRTCPLVLGGPGRACGAGRACPPVAADADALSLTMGKPVVSQHVPQISK